MLAGAPRYPGVILLFRGIAGGINPQPKAQSELICPCIWLHDKGDYKPHPWGSTQAPFSGVIPRQHRGSGIALNSRLHWNSSQIPIPTTPATLQDWGVLQSYSAGTSLPIHLVSYPSAKSIQTCLPCDHIMCHIPLWKRSHISRQNLDFLSFFLSPFLFLLVLFNWSDSTNWVMRINPAFITL